MLCMPCLLGMPCLARSPKLCDILAVRAHMLHCHHPQPGLQEAARLLSTMAAMRTANPSYRPCQ